MKTASIVIVALVFGIPIILAIWWCIWLLWLFVAGQVWPSGPDAVVRPGYWLFVAEWVFIGLLGRLLFKSDPK